MIDLQAALNHLDCQRNAALARAETRYDRECASINREFDIAQQRVRDAHRVFTSRTPTLLHEDTPAPSFPDTFTINQPLMRFMGRLWGGR